MSTVRCEDLLDVLRKLERERQESRVLAAQQKSKFRWGTRPGTSH
jgi:hypothetical protein